MQGAAARGSGEVGRDGGAFPEASRRRSPRVSPVPAFARPGVAWPRAGGREGLAAGGWGPTPTGAWTLQAPSPLPPPLQQGRSPSPCFLASDFLFLPGPLPSLQVGLVLPPSPPSSTWLSSFRTPAWALPLTSHPPAHTLVAIYSHALMRTYALVYPPDLQTHACVHTCTPMGLYTHTYLYTHVCRCTHPVPLPAPSLGPKRRFQPDGQLSLRSMRTPRRCLDTLPHCLVGGGAAQGVGNPHVGQELSPLSNPAPGAGEPSKC